MQSPDSLADPAAEIFKSGIHETPKFCKRCKEWKESYEIRCSDGGIAVRRQKGEAQSHSETDARTQLDFASGGGDFGNAAEARRVDEAVGSAVVGVVQRIEELGPGFEAGLLLNRKFAHDAEVHRLQTGAIDGVAAHVSIRVSGRRGGCSRA